MITYELIKGNEEKLCGTILCFGLYEQYGEPLSAGKVAIYNPTKQQIRKTLNQTDIPTSRIETIIENYFNRRSSLDESKDIFNLTCYPQEDHIKTFEGDVFEINPNKIFSKKCNLQRALIGTCNFYFASFDEQNECHREPERFSISKQVQQIQKIQQAGRLGTAGKQIKKLHYSSIGSSYETQMTQLTNILSDPEHDMEKVNTLMTLIEAIGTENYELARRIAEENPQLIQK